MLRYLLSNFTYKSSTSGFPSGTLAVNLSGSLAIGCLWALFEKGALSPNARFFLMTGILGGFTTFSTFTLENLNLLRAGEAKMALANILISNVAGIFLVFAGFKGVGLLTGAIRD